MSAYDASAKYYLVLFCWSEAYVREVQRPACGGRAHRLRVGSSPGSAPGAARPRQGRHQPVLAGQRARGGWVFEGCSVLRIKHPDTFSHTPFPRVRAWYGELFPPWMQSWPTDKLVEVGSTGLWACHAPRTHFLDVSAWYVAVGQ